MVCILTMESSDESGSEFAPDVVEKARRELLELVEVNSEDISDVEISDLSIFETDSESENDEDPM